MMRQDDRVIVVSAGPVGAVTALALVKKGIPVTLVEAEPEPPEDQRAATIHPPTVEMLAELGAPVRSAEVLRDFAHAVRARMCPRGHGAMPVAGRDSCRGPRLCPPYKSFPHFSSIARASSKDSAEVGGNLSSQ
jgi:2-polyprenyl-6-methoxyphenol hydroxylase-like FAD-dependent oxidoreductase